MFSPLRNKLAFIMAMLMQILFAAALLPSAAHSQNLYINKLSVWHSTASAYCNDIDYHFTTNTDNFSIYIPLYPIRYDMLVYSTNTLTDTISSTETVCNLGALDPDEDMEDAEIAWLPYTRGYVQGTMSRTGKIEGEGDGTTTSFSGNMTLFLQNETYADGVVTCRSEAGRTSSTSSNMTASVLS